MHRRHRAVNFVSLLAIVVGMFSPVLSLPVVAQEPADQATPVVETPVVLTPVTPVMPDIAEATCGDGVVFAQVATAAQTEGVAYTIGEPDESGGFTVTATLTDASVYTWADTGLDGWTVVENTATSSGTLTLCPIPESEEPIEQEIPVESGEGSDTGESTPEADTDSNASVISTPNTNARSSSMAPNAIDGVELTYAFETDKDHAAYGESVTFTATITNVGTADAGVYSFTTSFSIGGYAFVNPQIGPGDMPPGSNCVSNLNNDTRIECHHDGSNPIAPGQTHVYTATVIVDSTESCGIIVSRGGGNNFESDIELWAVGSRNGIGDSPSLNTSINCPTEESAPELTYEISADKATANPGDDITFTIIVTNNGTADSGQYQFLTQLSRSGPQLTLKDPLNVTIPEGISCGDLVPGSPVFNCNNTSGEPAILAPGDEHKFTFVAVASGDSCGESLTRGGGDTNQNPDLWAEGSRYREDPAPTFSIIINCDSDLTIELYTATEIGPGDSFDYTLYIDNVGSQVSGDYAVEIVVPQGISITSVPGTCQQDAGAGTIICSSTDVPPGDFHLHTIPASVDTDAATCTDVVSTATGVAGNWMTGRGSSEVINTIITPECYPEFSLSMNTDTPLVSSGDEVSVDIVTTNTTSSHRGTTFSINANFDPAIFPAADVQYTALDGVECTTNAAEGWFDCSAPRLAGDDSLVITMTLTVSDDLSPTECVNTTISAVGGNQGPWDAESRDPGASVAIEVNCDVPSPLSLEFAADTPTITHPDERVAFTITVTNTSSEPVSELNVVGYVPAAFVGDEWIVTDTDGSADCVIQTLEGTGAFCEGMTVPAQVGDVPGTLTVNYSLADSVIYPESACGEHQAGAAMQHPTDAEEGVFLLTSVTIDCTPTLIQTAVADRTSVAPGELVEYTISVENTSGWDFEPPDSAGQFFLVFLVNQQHGTFEGTWESSIPNSGCQELTAAAENYHGFACYLEPGGVIEAQTTETITLSVRAVAEPSDAICESSIDTRLLNTNATDDSDLYLPGPAVAIDCDPQLPELSITAAISDTDGTVPEITPFNYTVLVENTGGADSGPFSFTSDLPPGFVVGTNGATVPEGASCEHNMSNGGSAIQCYGPSIGPDDEPYLFTFRVIADSELYTGICDTPTSFTATGVAGAWGDPSSSTTPTFSVDCDAAPLLSVVFEADRTQAEAGDIINYTATITNTGNQPEESLSFVAYISDDATLLQNPPIATSAGMTCDPDGDRIDCRAQDMAPEDVHTLTYSVQVTPKDSGDSCGAISALFGFGTGEWDDDSDQYADVERLCHRLSIDLTDNMADGASVGLNEPFTYTITLSNTGDSEKGDFSFLSYFPEGVVLAPDSVLDSRCESTNVSGYTVVRCSGTNIHLGQGASLTFDVDVVAVDSTENPTCGTITAEAQITQGVWIEGQQAADQSTDIECISSFTYTAEPLEATVVPGGIIEFELTTQNTGNTRITALAIGEDNLPELPPGGYWTPTLELNGSPIELVDFDYLAPGDTLVMRIVSSEIPVDLTLPESEWCTTWIFNGTAHAEFSYGPNQTLTSDAAVTVNCTGLSIDQEVSSESIVPGDQVTYTITVTNHGNTTVSPLMVSHDASETGAIFSNWSVTSDTALECGLTENDDPACTFLTLAPQESVVITITGDAPAEPTEAQCAPVTSRAAFVYGETLPAARFSAGLTPPYTEVYSEPVTTQVSCQSGVDISSTAVVNAGDDGRVDAGDTVTFTIEVENTGNVTLYDLTISHDLAGVVWDDDLFIDELGPGETVTRTGTYTVTQEDIDAGEIVITTSVEGGLVPAIEAARVVVSGFAQPADDGSSDVSASITETIELTQEPGVRLEISSVANTGDDGELNLDDTITYVFTVTNTGNVTLTDLDVIGAMEGLIFSGDTTIASLAPNESVELTASYVVTQVDVDAGSVVSCADVVGMAPDDSAVSDLDNCVTNIVAPNPVPPVTPEPTATPDDPATPVSPVTPEPTDDDSDVVIGLPETGHGVGVITPILWIAATLGVVALGVGGFGIRRSRG